MQPVFEKGPAVARALPAANKYAKQAGAAKKKDPA
jgi:hypothetical protein